MSWPHACGTINTPSWSRKINISIRHITPRRAYGSSRCSRAKRGGFGQHGLVSVYYNFFFASFQRTSASPTP